VCFVIFKQLINKISALFFALFLGESPSSSASDVDNLNNQIAMDKATLPKGTNANVASNHVISVRTRPSLVRLLDFVSLIFYISRVLFGRLSSCVDHEAPWISWFIDRRYQLEIPFLDKIQ